jgi:energy-coupling factor transporter ATP-binding protein EcfA2
VPPEALFPLPGVGFFYRRIQSLASNGGFAMITGDPGLGKSKTLQLMAHRLEHIPDLTVGAMQRPQSTMGRFSPGAGATVPCRAVCGKPLWRLQGPQSPMDHPLPVLSAASRAAHR